MKYLLLSLLLIPSLSYGEEVLHKLECSTKEHIEDVVNNKHNEYAIAEGDVAIRSVEDKIYMLNMVFYYNKETTSYTLVGYNEEDFGCVMAIGEKFKPIIKGEKL